MIQKKVKKYNKFDSEREPELVHKIIPHVKDSMESFQKVSEFTSVPISIGKQVIQQSNQNPNLAVRNNIQDILNILKRPTQFTIIYSNGNKQNGKNTSTTQGQTILESDIPKFIESAIEQGVKYLTTQAFKEAIQQLRNSEILIDTYMQQADGNISPHLMLAVVLNLGIGFYKVGLFDEAFSCFENSDLRLKQKEDFNNIRQENNIKKDNFQLSHPIREDNVHKARGNIENVIQDLPKLGDRLKQKQLRLTLNLQICILFSEIGKHEDALDYSRKSAKLASHILIDSLIACSYIILKMQVSSDLSAAQLLKKQIEDQLKDIERQDESKQSNNFVSDAHQNNDQNEMKNYALQVLGNLLNENSCTLTQNDLDIACKSIPILKYITQNFLSLRDNLSSKILKRLRLAHILRELSQELLHTAKLNDTVFSLKDKYNFNLVDQMQLDMYFMNSSVKEKHWLLTSNILNLLQMKPLTLSEIAASQTIPNQILPDLTLRRIAETAISFYCISTETRFIEESTSLNNINLSYQISDSQINFHFICNISLFTRITIINQ